MSIIRSLSFVSPETPIDCANKPNEYPGNTEQAYEGKYNCFTEIFCLFQKTKINIIRKVSKMHPKETLARMP